MAPSRFRFWSDLPLSVKGLTVIGLPLIALLAMGLLTLHLLQERRQADQQLARAYQLQLELQQLQTLALDAGTGVQSYLLTGNEDVLRTFDDAKAVLPDRLERIAALLEPGSEQADRFATARAQVEQEFHAMGILLDYARILDGSPETIRGFVVSSQVVMDGLSAQIREIQREQQVALQLRERQQTASVERFQAVALANLAIGVVGGILGVLLYALGITQRVQLIGENAQRLARGLPPSVHPAGRDELGRLDEALRDASALLSAREAQLRQANRQTRARLDELTRRNEQITLLNQLGTTLHRCQHVEQIVGVLRVKSEALLPGTSGVLDLNGRTSDESERGWGPTPPNPEAFPPPWQEGGVKGGPRVLRFEMRGQEELLGWLYMHHPDGIPAATEQLMAAVADRVGLAIANLRLRQSLEAQATRDPLTDLYNRRHLERVLERELRHADRSSAPLAVIVADIDHFKQFNDRFGHDAGDEVLRAFGRLLRDSFRARDVPCRYGGEEFLVVMPETGLDDAHRRAERLARQVRELRVELPSGSLEMISVSIGVAVYPEHGETPTNLVRSADEALYRAKEEGRNRVALAN